MGIIEDLKRELAAQSTKKLPKIEILSAEALRRIKDFCKQDNKKAGDAFTTKEIGANIAIPMLEKESDNGEDFYAALEIVLNDLIEKGYFVERESDKTLLITGAGVLWLNK